MNRHERLQEVFAGALERDGAARATYLDMACGDDAALRAEVDSLLDADRDAIHVLDNVSALEAGSSDCATRSAGAANGAALSIDVEGYRILEPLGEGGMGIVYRAEQLRPVRRDVALKVIKLGMDSRAIVARFDAERQALAMMNHPGVATVFDAGLTREGRPFFAMELVEGEPIIDYCDAHTLPPRERLRLFLTLCSAVQHAHQKGVIHRDLKPSNVLVSSVGEAPVAKVIDFGVAKAIAGRLTERTVFTEHGQLIGTPEYMSPEQAETSGLDVDSRADIYALGVLLYELLTGVLPFESEALRGAGFAEIRRIIREVAPAKPSTRLSGLGKARALVARRRRMDAAGLARHLKGDLDWIVMKCLEKDRARRYDSVGALARDVERYLADEPVEAGPPGVGYRFQKFVRRHRVMVTAGTAVAAALLIGAIAFAWQAKEARIAADAAERAAYQAQIVSAAHAVEDQRIDAAGALLAATSPRLRGWEYRHLASRLDRTLPSPFPADWAITDCVTSADSRVVAVSRSVRGGPAEWVVLDRDLRTERPVVRPTDAISFALSPDGTRAVWAAPEVGDRRPAVLWDIETMSVLATMSTLHVERPGTLVHVTWAATSDRFAISSADEFHVHDGRTGALLESRRAAGFVLFTGDDRWMIMGSSRQNIGFNARELQLIDARTFEPMGDIFHLESPAAVYPWRSTVVCTMDNGMLLLLEIVDGALRERSKFPAGITNFNAPVLSPDGSLIAVGSVDGGRVRVWDAHSATLRGDFAGPQSGVPAQFFLPDSTHLWACDMNGHHRVWPTNVESPGVLTAHRSYVYPAIVSKDGGQLLTGGWDGLVGQSRGLKWWDARTGALVAEYGRPGEIFRWADMTPDGRFVVVGIDAEYESNPRTEVIDLTTGAVRVPFTPRATASRPTFRPTFTVVHPDAKRVICSYSSGDAYVWDLATGKVLWQTDLRAQLNQAVISTAVAPSPDGRVLALADRQLGIRLVNADTYADIRRWNAHEDSIWSLSFSPDGKWLLSASDDQTVGVWEVTTGALIARLVGHGAKVLCAAMSPDGTRIASGGRDGIVRLWDTTHFENVAQLGGHGDYIYCLTWSPDGEQLISTSGDSTVRIWDTRTLAEQVAAVRARSEALPRLEAKIAKARAESQDARAAVEAVIASPESSARERELARQVAIRFGLVGTPAYYRAPRTAKPIVIDGRIDEAAWSAAEWSEPFVDIEGDVKPEPRFETRMRMLWDDANLYVAAHLEEPHVWATVTNRDDIVLSDNDFEVFIDPEGDSRFYGEVEVNALGTIFDLRLERPYTEGGPARNDWSPEGLRAAAAVHGSINDPSDTDDGWTVEIAIPHAAFEDHAATPIPPHPGDVWRINFSRVEWQHDVMDGRYVKRPGTKEDNWVWTPQRIVDMHDPRTWGFVEFIYESGSGAARPSTSDEAAAWRANMEETIAGE